MADPSPAQRHYRAPCPGCGAPVEFRSAQSTHAVCGYCQSTVVRQGEVLSRLGKMAELFDDHSLLQLMASGTLDGQGFTLVGRLQYTYGEGSWTEWQALLNDGSTGSLSEDNGAYVFSRPVAPGRDLPAADQFRVGATTAINGQKYSVASNEMVALRSAQGELPRLPALGQPFAMVELRGQDSAQVLSIDFGPTLAGAPPAVSLGRPVTLDELQMSGLKDQSAKDEKGRQFNCPNCGATVEVALAQSKSITCKSCNSLIDLSAGIGGELRHAEQHEPMRPLIPLGTLGQLEGVVWQVVGFQHRMGQEPGDDEQFGWQEYLLYNAKRGFSFLVDATDGWSLVRAGDGCALAGRQWAKRHLARHHLPAAVCVQGRDHLRGRRVLLAGAARPENRQPRFRVRQTAAVDGAVAQRNHLVQRPQDRKCHGGQCLQARRPERPAQAGRRRALHGGAQRGHHSPHRHAGGHPDGAVAAQPLQPLRPARGELQFEQRPDFGWLLWRQLQRGGAQMSSISWGQRCASLRSVPQGNLLKGGHHGY